MSKLRRSAHHCNDVILFCARFTHGTWCRNCLHSQTIQMYANKNKVIASFRRSRKTPVVDLLTVKSVGKKGSRSFPSYRYIISASRLLVGTHTACAQYYTLHMCNCVSGAAHVNSMGQFIETAAITVTCQLADHTCRWMRLLSLS